MTKKILALDAGHGGNDPGAVGNGLREKDLTLDIAKRVASHLAAHYPDIYCRLTRTADQFVTLGQRTRDANAWGADCLVSIHINSAATDAANGFESYRYVTDTESSQSYALQKQLHPRLATLWSDKGRKNRGIKRANFHMVREFKGAAVLLELGFIVNDQDAALLSDAAFLDANAQAIAEGVADYLDVPRVVKPDGLYRVIVDGTQVGAYAEDSNVTRQVTKALRANKRRIEIEAVE